MTSFYNTVHHSSSVSEISTAPPSPSNTAAGGNARYGVVVPNRVFVGGIPTTSTETDLQELFSQFGKVKDIKIINDRGVCKGFGFVTFETDEEAKKVLQLPDSVVLKERRLNIAPAIMKQQPYGYPFDVAQPTGTLLYHNGTPFTYQNGMAFFAGQQAPQSAYSPRDTPMYPAPFGPSQSTTNQPYAPIMYASYTPTPLSYQQQYQYPYHFDYYKTVGPTSQYVYAAPPGTMNGALNNALNGGLGSASQSPSPGYGPSSAPTSEMYYNAMNHQTPLPMQHQPMYPVESSPAHSEDWNTESRQTHTPVVSLLKLHEEGSVEMEIKRTPKKSFPSGPGGPKPRSRRPGRPATSPSQASPQGRINGRGGNAMGSLAGQRSASSPHLPSSPSSCIHRSTSLSPSNQVPPLYIGSRQNQHQHQGYSYPRRGGGGMNMRSSSHRTYSSNNRSSHHSNTGHSSSNQISGVAQSSGPNPTFKSSSAPKNPAESVNGVKTGSINSLTSLGTNSSAIQKQGKTAEGGAGDASTNHSLPLSPPSTPLPQETSICASAGGGDSEVCQKMEALAL